MKRDDGPRQIRLGWKQLAISLVTGALLVFGALNFVGTASATPSSGGSVIKSITASCTGTGTVTVTNPVEGATITLKLMYHIPGDSVFWDTTPLQTATVTLEAIHTTVDYKINVTDGYPDNANTLRVEVASTTGADFGSSVNTKSPSFGPCGATSTSSTTSPSSTTTPSSTSSTTSSSTTSSSSSTTTSSTTTSSTTSSTTSPTSTSSTTSPTSSSSSSSTTSSSSSSSSSSTSTPPVKTTSRTSTGTKTTSSAPVVHHTTNAPTPGLLDEDNGELSSATGISPRLAITIGGGLIAMLLMIFGPSAVRKLGIVRSGKH